MNSQNQNNFLDQFGSKPSLNLCYLEHWPDGAQDTLNVQFLGSFPKHIPQVYTSNHTFLFNSKSSSESSDHPLLLPK